MNQQEMIRETLIYYAGNCATISEFVNECGINHTDKLEDELRNFQSEWDDVGCEDDGLTIEQDEQLNAILTRYTNTLMRMV